MRRTALTRDDCHRRDQYLRQHRLRVPSVCGAFDLSKRASAGVGRGGEQPDADRAITMQREAATVMGSLFHFAPYAPTSASGALSLIHI